MDHVVIVGASASGAATATQLRGSGFKGAITMIGAEKHAPYDRPPLSKGFLSRARDASALALADRDHLADLGVELHLGVEAVTVEEHKRTLLLSDGTTQTYDYLVAATGVRPRQLPETAGMDNVLTLRTMDDSARLSNYLVPGSRLVIVGAGFVGCEVASTAVQMGVQVDVVEAAAAPFQGRLHASVAAALTGIHVERGVRFHTGETVGQLFTKEKVATGIELGSGRTLPADAILVCVGSIPNVEWLQGTTLDLSNGVKTNEFGTAGSGIFAVGDVANFYHPRLHKHVRLEHRTNASESAMIVAKNVCGAAEPYSPLPSFWTDQYERKIQMFGHAGPASEIEFVEGSLEDQRWVARIHEQGEFVAVVGSNAARAMLPHRRSLQDRYEFALPSVA